MVCAVAFADAVTMRRCPQNMGRCLAGSNCSILVALLTLCMVSAEPRAAAETFALNDALAAAYQTSPQLAAARAGLRAVDEGVPQARAARRPSINASGSYGVQQGRVQGIANPFNSTPLTGQVTLAQPIFSSGRTDAEIGHAISEVNAGRGELDLTEQSVLLDAVQAYLDVLRDEAILKSNQTNRHMLQDELAGVRAQQLAGAVTRTDVDQAKARLARSQSDLAIAELQLTVSRAAFEAQIGQPAGTLEPSPKTPPLPQSKEAAYAEAEARNPALIKARAEARAADYAVDDATSALLPQFSISAQYQYLRDDAGTDIFASSSRQQNLLVLGQVTIPIYQGGGDEAGIRRAKELRGQSLFNVSAAERNVRQNVDEAWQAVISAQASLISSRAQLEANRAAVEGVAQAQQGGERSVLDVLNAREELLSSEVAVATSQHDVVFAGYRLLAATGQMNARALSLKVKLYDPDEHFKASSSAWFGFGD